MLKAISKNKTMSGPLSSLKKYKKSRKRMTLRLHGSKVTGKSIGLPEKSTHSKSDDLLNSTNSIRVKSISLEFNEIPN